MGRGRALRVGVAFAATLSFVWPQAIARGAGEAAMSWKGSESMTLVAMAASPERCGDPPVLEARFAGDGIDTVGGVFAVIASGCINMATLEVTDLEATDTFAAGGELLISPQDVALTLDADTCIASNASPVPFEVGGGTGRFEDASGSGTYHIALNWPPCNGITAPARVWFEGSLISG